MEWFLVIIAVTGTGIILLYNRLVRQKNIVSEAWAGIDVQLQKRHELVPNLIATVKGYMQHEASVLESVTLKRSSVPDRVGEISGQETELSRSLGKLLALAEDYPQADAEKKPRTTRSARSFHRAGARDVHGDLGLQRV